MCGISAIASFGPDPEPVGPALADCHRALRHRGPDGEGFLWVGRDRSVRRASEWPAELDHAPTALAVAFRQLKVQDLSDASVQPLKCEDGTRWIALNGEIYNAPALAAELSARGHRFRTQADTEVALAAYREWGSACFERFNGMWAILIVDLATRRLVGSRDRLGIKPLYYALDDSRLAFASEPQALVRARLSPSHADPVRIREFLTGMAPQGGDQTFFAGVQLVPAATVFEVDLEAARPTRPEFRVFWRPDDFACRTNRLPTFDTAVAEVRALMESSIELQSRAAVPVGCLLSGGLDTSYVARTLANRALRSGGAPARSFSIVFSERDMSELPYIWSVLRPGGLTNVRFQLNPTQAFQDVDTVVGIQGQPLLGQDLIAQYHAYRLARDHGAVVILEGQGADELLGGMPLYAEAMRNELWSQNRFGELALELWADMRRNGHSRLGSGGRIARWLMPTGLRRAQSPVPPWVDQRALVEPAEEAAGETSSDPSLLNQYLFRLVTKTNLPTVLQYQDRSSMAHGIEGRVPFLDHRFVEYCFGLPSSYKVHRGVRKRVLVHAARGIVPDAVLQRRTKKTFISKTKWVPLRERYGPQLREMAAGLGGARLPWVNPAGLQSYVDDFLAGRHDDVAGMWRAYTAWRWIDLFGVRQ